MKVLGRAKLQIQNQSAFLTQIASVYQSFLRAAMEYVDNAVDAASTIRQNDDAFIGQISINIDTREKSISFQDNCGGMSPETLIRLLSAVGNSQKRGQAWTNGQFGFGIHAFRGFAKTATFQSKTSSGITAQIQIDRDAGESESIPCSDVSDTGPLTYAGTKVTISRFDTGVFKKSGFFEGLIAEIRQHFDDVIRTGIVRITIAVDGGHSEVVTAFDYSALPGETITETLSLSNGSQLRADLKVLDKISESRAPALTINGRRIQQISELRSFRSFAKAAGRGTAVWGNPFLVGSIEVAGALEPTLTRDDVKAGETREEAFASLLELQLRVEEAIRERMEQKRQQAYDSLAKKVSDCLASVLRKYKIQFDFDAGSNSSEGISQKSDGPNPFGGDQPGGGGAGGDGVGGGGHKKGDGGDTGPGNSDTGGGDKGPGKSQKDGDGDGGVGSSSGAAPQINFSEFPETDERVIAFGSTLTVNTAHADFASRKVDGSATVGTRLVAYVAQVVAGPCVEFLYAKRGKPLIAANVANQVTDIAVRLESLLTETNILEEMIARSIRND